MPSRPRAVALSGSAPRGPTSGESPLATDGSSPSHARSPWGTSVAALRGPVQDPPIGAGELACRPEHQRAQVVGAGRDRRHEHLAPLDAAASEDALDSRLAIELESTTARLNICLFVTMSHAGAASFAFESGTPLQNISPAIVSAMPERAWSWASPVAKSA